MIVKVSDIAIFNAKARKYKGILDEIVYIDTSSVEQGRYLEPQVLRVDQDEIPSRAQRAVQDGTIIISTVRPNLKHYAYCDNPADNVVVSSGFVTVDADKSVVDPKFLYYVLTSNRTTNYLSSIASTAVSAYPSFNPDDLGNLIIDIPDELSIQRAIAKILTSLDDKIENNIAICADLEAMAKLLYDYWFIQFDFPDENGKPYKSSGGKMVWNEDLKREIPEGWEVKSVSDIANLQIESIFPENEVLYNHYSIPAYDTDKIPVYESGSVIESNKYIVPCNSVLVSKLNPQFKRIWPVSEPPENSICSTEFLPIQVSGVGLCYLFGVLNTEAFSTHLRQKASSSTGSRKRIDPENCVSYQFAYDQKVAKEYDEMVVPLLKQMMNLPFENHMLVSLRDFMLPMLMNGQVKVGG